MSGPAGLGGLFTRTASERGDATALVCTDDRRSFARVESDANRLARAMSQRGVGAGDLVGLGLRNSIEMVECFLAVWKLGAVPFPLSYRLPDREFDELCGLGEPPLVVGRGGVGIDELVAEASTLDDAPLPDVESSPWKAVGSGGSTGRSKLIVDAGGSPDAIRVVSAFFNQEPRQVNLLSAPLYHNGPIVWSLPHLLVGGTVVIMERFDAREWLTLCEQEAVGWAYVVPTMLHRILSLDADALERDFSALDVLLCASAPFPEWLHRRTIEVFGAQRVYEFYGATEVGCSMIRGDDWLAHPGSVGVPSIAEVEIRDEDGQPLPAGEVGEIWLRPRFGGFSFRYRGAEAKESDGYISVGDMGHLDTDGYLYLADRRTDLIITGGANVYPAEVEAAVLEHPSVVDCAVIGLPDDEWGQRVHAVVQRSGEVTVEELDEHTRRALVSYKVPKSWELVDDLPRDPSGKIRRAQLRTARS